MRVIGCGPVKRRRRHDVDYPATTQGILYYFLYYYNIIFVIIKAHESMCERQLSGSQDLTVPHTLQM